jgi:hypothetical protein
MNSPSSPALPRLLFGNEPPQNAVGFVIHGSVQKKSSTETRGKTSQKNNCSLIARATRQVFPRCQPAIQWWQLQRPLQEDSSFQSPQAAESWELDLSQE